MNKIKLLNGLEIPQIGFGTWQIPFENAEKIIDEAIQTGYKHIDTAQIYNNEFEIGKAIAKHSRDELFITTKVWISNFKNENDFLLSIKQSLQRLQLKFVDLILLHWPINGLSINAYKWLEKAQDLNYTKSIGVSNFMKEHLKEILNICKYKPVINQIEFNVLHQQKDLINFCFANKIAVTGYSNLKPYFYKQISEENIQTLEKIAKKYNKSVASIILRWVTQENIIIIPKSSSAQRMKENLSIFDFKISLEDINLIRNMDQNNYEKAYKIAAKQGWASESLLKPNLLFDKHF